MLGEYPLATKDVAKELNAKLIDLNELSVAFFSGKGQEYGANTCFMNCEAGLCQAYPNGQKDNSHFQVKGGTEVARLVIKCDEKTIKFSSNLRFNLLFIVILESVGLENISFVA